MIELRKNERTNKCECAHRFWIEAMVTHLMNIEQSDREHHEVIQFDANSPRMVIKHYKLRRCVDGKLVDDSENEGWPFYWLECEQLQRLKRGSLCLATKIEGQTDGESALVFTKISKTQIECYFWCPAKAISRSVYITKESDNDTEFEQLEQLEHQPKECDGRLKVGTINRVDDEAITTTRIITYQVLRRLSNHTGIPHQFSPEHCFAMEFTIHYDVLANYIPEFGRLRELHKLMVLANVLAHKQQSNRALIRMLRFGNVNEKILWPTEEDLVKAHEFQKNIWRDVNADIKRVFNAANTDIDKAISSPEASGHSRQELRAELKNYAATEIFNANFKGTGAKIHDIEETLNGSPEGMLKCTHWKLNELLGKPIDQAQKLEHTLVNMHFNDMGDADTVE